MRPKRKPDNVSTSFNPEVETLSNLSTQCRDMVVALPRAPTEGTASSLVLCLFVSENLFKYCTMYLRSTVLMIQLFAVVYDSVCAPKSPLVRQSQVLKHSRTSFELASNLLLGSTLLFATQL